MATRRSFNSQAYAAFVEALKGARDSAAVTQAALAERLGKPQNYISKYENRERRIDVIELRQICHALGIDFVQFVRKLDKVLADPDL